MHFAKVNKSERLQRVLKLLSDGKPYTTREIIEKAYVCAVSTIIAELRANNFNISCEPIKKGVYEYKLNSDDSSISCLNAQLGEYADNIRLSEIPPSL